MRPLGTTGLEISEFVTGVPAAAQGAAKEPLLARIDEGREAGITMVDARHDGDRVVAEWLGDRQPDDVLVGAVIGRLGVPGPREADLTHAAVTGAIAARVKRFGRFDLATTAGADPETPLTASLEAFAAALESGAIRAYGIGRADVWKLENWLTAADKAGLPRPSWVRNRYHLLDLRDERDLLPLAAGEGIAHIATDPLADGALTGRFAAAADVEPDPDGPEPDPRLGRVAALRTLARELDVSVEGAALAWLRVAPGGAAVEVTPRSSADWDPMHEALERDLDEDFADRIRAAVAP